MGAGRAYEVALGGGEGWTYVRPVERRTPARKADTGAVSMRRCRAGGAGLKYLGPHRRRSG